jgi:hypothetical protein
MSEEAILDVLIKALTSYRAGMKKPETAETAETLPRVPRQYKKLTEKQKNDIRAKWDARVASQTQMARDYGVCEATIARALYGRR